MGKQPELPGTLADYGRILRMRESEGSRIGELAAKVTYLYERDRWARSLARRRAAVDAVPIVRPIFLLGLQGGGLTLIGRALHRNRRVVTIGGDCTRWTADDELGTIPNRMRRLPPSLWGCKHRIDLATRTFGVKHSSAYACDELLPLYRRTDSDATDADAAAFKRVIREHLYVLSREPAEARFLDKTQTYTVAMRYVAALLDGCEPHFVLVTRDPYWWVPRALAKQPPDFNASLTKEEKLTIVARHWANSFSLALDDGAQVENFLTVRFEDFLSDPEDVLRQICRFAKLDFDPEQVPQAHQRRPPGTLPWDYKWYPLQGRDPERRESEETSLVESVCGAIGSRLGYEHRTDLLAH